MKKAKIIISILLSAFILVSSSVAASAAIIKYVRGDANNDGRVNIKDVTMVQRILVGIDLKQKSVVKRNADVDQNGLSINDATEIQRYLVSFGNPYNIGATYSYDEYELPVIPS